MDDNFAQLQPLPTASHPVHWSSLTAPSEEASFLTLRQLSTRKRVRVSSAGLNLDALPGKADLFAIANTRGWFAAASWSKDGAAHIVCSPLADLRSAFFSAGEEEEVEMVCKRKLPLPQPTPSSLAFAFRDERLVVGFSAGNVLVFDTASLFREGEDAPLPIFTFDPPSPAALRYVLPNPGEMPQLVAVMHEQQGLPGSKVVQVIDLEQSRILGGWLSGNAPETTPTTISWSPKGKQIAVGLQSGDTVTYDPKSTASPKIVIHKPPSAHGLSLLSIVWLSNAAFYAVYAPLPLTPDTEYIHFIIVHDARMHTATDVRLNAPLYPFPGLRPSNIFTLVLRNWDAFKFLLLIGDSASSDIGVVGSLAQNPAQSEGAWSNISMEEGCSATMPLDRDQNDTVLTGLEIDLTSSADDSRSSPTMYSFVSDGTIIGWDVLYAESSGYPGMVVPSLSAASAPSMDTSMSMDSSMTPKPPSPKPSAFGFSQTSGPASSSFAQTSDSSTTPGTTAFGSRVTPAFGVSGFGQQQQSSTSNPFGKPNAAAATSFSFGTSTQTSAFGSSSTPNAFSSFNSAQPTSFNQPTFGFGQSNQASAPAAVPAESEMTDVSGDSLGGLSLGTSLSSEGRSSSMGIFGIPSPLPLPPDRPANQPVSAFTSSSSPSFIKPATGFGALGNAAAAQTTSTPAGQPKRLGFVAGGTTTSSASATTTTASPAFGISGFQTKLPVAVAGQSRTGTAAPSAPIWGQASGASGGFSAFASGATASFAAAAKSGDAAPSQSPFSSEACATNAFGKAATHNSVFGNKNESVFGAPSRAEDTAASPFAAPAPSASSQPILTPTSGQTAAPRTTGTGTPPSSPENSPVRHNADLPASPAATPPGSPRAVFGRSSTSSFKASVPSPATGAFGNLPTTVTAARLGSGAAPAPAVAPSTPSPFRPASGFGAFSGMSDGSAFASPKTTGTTAVNAFSASSSSVFAPSPSMSSAFGGGGIPVFGQSSFGTEPKLQPTKKLTDGKAETSTSTVGSGDAFAKFNTPTTAFGAYATRTGTSTFGDLLRGDAKAAQAPSITTEEASQSTSKPSAVASPVEEPKNKDVVASTVGDHEETDDEKVDSPPEPLSASASSSFVKISPPASDDETERLKEKTPESDEDDAEERDDDIEDFLSDSFSPDGSADEEDGSGSDDEGSRDETPGPPPPKIGGEKQGQLAANPSQDALSAMEKKGGIPSSSPSPQIAITTTTTTPPGTPEKPKTSSPSPEVSTPSPSPTSLFGGLGIGRPSSTRPVRSSPLAGTPVSGGESDEEKTVKTTLPKAPAPAQSPFGFPGEPTALLPQQTLTPKSFSPTADTRSAQVRPAETNKTPFGITGAPSPLHRPPVVSPAPVFSFPLPKPQAPFSLPKSAGNVFDSQSSEFDAPFMAPAASSPFGAPAFFAKPANTSPNPSPTGVSPGTQQSSKLSHFSLAKPTSENRSSASPSPSPFSFGQMGGPNAPIPLQMPTPSRPTNLAPSPLNATIPQPEPGMQAEFLALYDSMNKELEEFKMLGETVNKRRVEIYQPSKISHTKADLLDENKWKLGDIKAHRQLMKALNKDLEQVETQTQVAGQSLRELESGLLRGMTRKAEIERFTRARSDPEFAKMLNARTLPPDHIESQNQLRRHISDIKDRVEKLESCLEKSEKKIAESKSGRPSFKPPTLDTVHRTLRNIDTAIVRQSEVVASLTDRVASMDLSATATIPSYSASRGGLRSNANRFSADPEPETQRVRNVSPHIANTTAAALNAERAAARLKSALLAERAEPLYNNRASLVPLPQSLQTRQRHAQTSSTSLGSSFTVDSLPLMPNTPLTNISFLPLELTPTLPAWALPNPSDDTFKVGGEGSDGGHRPAGRQRETRRHGSSVPLKRSGGGSPSVSPGPMAGDREVNTASPSRPTFGPGIGASFFPPSVATAAQTPSSASKNQTTFDWGPLPGVRPQTTLSSDVRTTAGFKSFSPSG